MNYTQTRDGNAAVLKVKGELDALTCAGLRPALEALSSRKEQAVTVDLSDLRLIDSWGVGVLVALYKRVRAAGGSVNFVGVVDQPLAIFKLLRLDRAFALKG